MNHVFLARLEAIKEKVKALMAENSRLRNDNMELRRKLLQTEETLEQSRKALEAMEKRQELTNFANTLASDQASGEELKSELDRLILMVDRNLKMLDD